MAEFHRKNLDQPDERKQLDMVTSEEVHLGDLTVARVTHQPGWRWSTHIRPYVGGDWCQVRHVGVVLSGRLGVSFEDGSTVEFGPDDVCDIPPGHEGWTVGDEPVVLLEWAGVRAFTGFTGDASKRVLTTLLFTDLVDSTAMAARLGDAAWHDLLATHYEVIRDELQRFAGREVSTTGDGVVATFEAPARALQAAGAIRRRSNDLGIHIRAGVHVGEVQLVGRDVRGIAVHEAARIMAAAGADEILVSETTRALAQPSGVDFEPFGAHTLKGIPGEWTLFSYVEAR
jgi:class 3 adenylate cyclase